MPLAPSSIAVYVSTLRRMFGFDPLVHRAVPGFGDFLSELPEQVLVPEDTTNATRGIIRGALRWMYAEAGRTEEGVEAANRIPFRHEIKKRKRYPTRAEIADFVKVADEYPSPKRELLLVPLALGLRANEYLNLSRESVEQAVRTKTLTVLRKGGEEGELPAARVVSMFRRLLGLSAHTTTIAGKRPWEFVWELYSGTERGAYWTMRRLVGSVAKESGTGTWSPHMLRHAFASEMIRDGAPLPIVQKALGHASYQTTVNTYVHLDVKDLEKWMDKKDGDK